MTRKSISNPIYRTHLIGGIGKRNEKSHVHLYFGIPAKNIAKLVTAVQFHLFSSARKILIPCIQAYMPYESSEDSSNQPNSPVGSTRWPLDPLGPPGPPNPPPQTHKQVSWPHCTLKITSTASQITFTFIPVTPAILVTPLVVTLRP